MVINEDLKRMNKKIGYVFRVIIFVGLLALSFFMGRFTQWFDSNMCYSSILDTIKNEFSISNNEEKDIRLNNILDKIETRGYETECNKIEQDLKEYMH